MTDLKPLSKPSTAPARGAVRSQHQAIVVVERRMGRSDDPKGNEQMAIYNQHYEITIRK